MEKETNGLFCKIINGQIKSDKLYEDEEIFAFKDIHPVAPVHFLVIPKRHIPNVMEINEADAELLGRIIFRAQTLAAELGCAENGFRLVNNCKSYGGQTVDHLHFHVIGGRQLSWPPG